MVLSIIALGGHLLKRPKWFWKLFGLWIRGEFPRIGRCKFCNNYSWLIYVQPMTMYYTEPGQPDQNYVGFLCRKCKDQYDEYWTEQWKEYYSGRL